MLSIGEAGTAMVDVNGRESPKGMKRLEKDGSAGPAAYMVFDFQEDPVSFHKSKLLLRHEVIVDDRLCVLGPEDLPSLT